MKLRTCGSFRTYRDFILPQSWKENCILLARRCDEVWSQSSFEKDTSTFQRDGMFMSSDQGLKARKSKNLAWKVHCLGKKTCEFPVLGNFSNLMKLCTLMKGMKWNETFPNSLLFSCASPQKQELCTLSGPSRVKFWGNKFGCEDGKVPGTSDFVDENL